MQTSLALALTTAALTLAATTTLAHADAMLLSTTQQDYVVTFELPSGRTQSDTLYKGTDTLGYLAVPAKPGKPLAVTVTEPDGTVVVTGTVVDNRSYVLMPSGKGTRLVAAGLVAQTASTPYAGVGVVNALPESFTIDLSGDSGQAGVKNVKVATTFDLKATTKLPPADTRYRAAIHQPDGDTVTGLSAIDAGTYVVIHRNYQGVVTLSGAGYIELPKPTVAKPKTKGRRK